MTQRGRVWGIVVAAAITGACGGPERGVASRYFSALAAGDHQTLTSFATVRLEEQVDAWEIVGTSEEQTEPVSLPGLAKKRAELKAEFDANKEAANNYYNEHADEVDDIRELGSPCQAGLDVQGRARRLAQGAPGDARLGLDPPGVARSEHQRGCTCRRVARRRKPIAEHPI